VFNSSHVKNVFFVIERVVYDNGIISDDFIKVYNKLIKQGKKIFFLSNNAVFSRSQWARMLNNSYPLRLYIEGLLLYFLVYRDVNFDMFLLLILVS